MLTIKIPKTVLNHQMFAYINQVIQLGIESIELDVQTFGQDDLVLCSHSKEAQVSSEEDFIRLNDVFAYLTKAKADIRIILNLKEQFLENRVKTLVDKWHLKKQVFYSGILKPIHFTPWDKPYIIYNIENCLPNVYQLDTLKRTHFDVIYYFCNKYKVDTIRLHINAFTEEMITWAEKLHLKLSIYGISSFEKAKELIRDGVEYVSMSALCVKEEI